MNVLVVLLIVLCVSIMENDVTEGGKNVVVARINKCGNCMQEGHNKNHCPKLPCGECNSSDHVKKDCPNVTVKQRQRKTVVNMSTEQHSHQNERKLVANMSTEQHSHQNERKLVVNMSTEQHSQQKERDNERDHKMERISRNDRLLVQNLSPAQRDRQNNRNLKQRSS